MYPKVEILIGIHNQKIEKQIIFFFRSLSSWSCFLLWLTPQTWTFAKVVKDLAGANLREVDPAVANFKDVDLAVANFKAAKILVITK